MDILLNDNEARVLGCLMEKSMTTPEYYPLSLVSLTTACNQKSNRNPVVSFDEGTVMSALQGLKEKQLVVLSESSRVAKYSEIFVNSRKLLTKEASLLMVLLLRGPQTFGELRTRADRAYSFGDLSEVERTIHSLEEANYVIKLPRQPGRKEHRYAHLLAGEPDVEQITLPNELTTIVDQPDNNKIEDLETEIAALRTELQTLRTDFDNFKAQFD